MAYQPPPSGWRTFLILWVTQSISVLGSGLTYFATTIWLTQTVYPSPGQKPQLAVALSAISLAFALSILIEGPVAGAWADRHDRKRTMIVTDLASGLMSLLLAVLVVTDRLQTMWSLYLLQVEDKAFLDQMAERAAAKSANL